MHAATVQVLGAPDAKGGIALFAAPCTPGPPGSVPDQAQAGPGASQQAVRGEGARLRFCFPGLPPALVPLRLRPGAPAALRMLPGHPFCNQVRAKHAQHSLLALSRTLCWGLHKCGHFVVSATEGFMTNIQCAK